MPQKLLIEIILAVIIVAALAVAVYFLVIFVKDRSAENKLNLPDYMLDAYPVYFEGTLNLSGSTAVFNMKAKAYTLQPADPGIYKREGFRDGQDVEIQGKIVKDEYIIVGEIK